jgi:hypothetical protein
MKIKLYINTGFANCKHTEIIDCPEEWEKMSQQEKEEWLDDEALDFLNNHIDYGAIIIEGEE